LTSISGNPATVLKRVRRKIEDIGDLNRRVDIGKIVQAFQSLRRQVGAGYRDFIEPVLCRHFAKASSVASLKSLN
jgi:hypothetical protein